MTPMRRFASPLLLLLLALCSVTATAQDRRPPPPPPPPPGDKGPQQNWPAWDQLTAQQRDVLVSQLRDRWNDDPSRRGRMMDHAQRWQRMSPQQRDQAKRGMERYERMSPEQRDQARALFDRMRTLPPAQRKQLRDQWDAMTPQQREDWVRAHPPSPEDDPD